MASRRNKPARELAARALCRHDGHAEDIKFEGKRMWESYLPAADAVLEAIGWNNGKPDDESGPTASADLSRRR